MNNLQKNNIKAILFIDFDGVLHRTRNFSCLFENNWRLEKLLKENPNIRIVFSTSWRYLFSFKFLVSFFNPQFKHCFIGSTPIFFYIKKDKTLFRGLKYIRHNQVLSWLYKHKLNHIPWMAIDDKKWFFGDTENLVFTQNGWDDYVDNQLKIWLSSIY